MTLFAPAALVMNYAFSQCLRELKRHREQAQNIVGSLNFSPPTPRMLLCMCRYAACSHLNSAGAESGWAKKIGRRRAIMACKGF
jgi:hypothetical protein